MDAARRDAGETEKLLSEKLGVFARATFDEETGSSVASEQEIEKLLERLSAAIDRLEAVGGHSAAGRAHIARFRAIAHEKQVDWSKASSAAKQKRERQQLLKSTEKLMGKDKDTTSENAKALYEKEMRGIQNSRAAMDNNINLAMSVQDALKAQADKLRGGAQGLMSMGENIPGVNVLIKAAGKKKTRDNMIVATAISACLCVMFWVIVA